MDIGICLSRSISAIFVQTHLMPEENLSKAERKCKDCGAILGAGREDRQYCDDACRTNYNNRMRRAKRDQPAEAQKISTHTNAEPSVPEYIARIQAILVNNRRILSHICDGNTPGRITERDLIGKGFNTKFFTSETDPPYQHYRFCFEYGYRKEDDEKYLVICRKREVL